MPAVPAAGAFGEALEGMSPAAIGALTAVGGNPLTDMVKAAITRLGPHTPTTTPTTSAADDRVSDELPARFAEELDNGSPACCRKRAGRPACCAGRSPPCYGTQDAEVFHGREVVTARLVTALAGRPARPGVLVVAGASRAGKSSLSRAGSVPMIARGS